MRHFCSIVFGLLLLWSGRSFALDQLAHRWISEDACQAAGFDPVFCTRVGVEDGNVDAREWDVMAAHAQASSADDLCGGAAATLKRLHGLGAELGPLATAIAQAHSDTARVPAIEAFADVLGQAMHTFQDLCAHEGMTNIQHAWFSASDQCAGTKLSPDVRPEAEACARELSAEVFTVVKEALADRDVHPADFPETTAYASRLLPASKQLCEYLVSADQWDGKDRRWKLEAMEPALLDALMGGWRGDPVPSVDCATLEADPAPDVSVLGGAPWCASAQAVCESAGEPGRGWGCAAAPGSAVVPFAALAWIAFALRSRRRDARPGAPE